MTTKDARISRGIPRSLVLLSPSENEPFRGRSRTKESRRSSGRQPRNCAPRTPTRPAARERRAALEAFGRAAGTCPDAPSRRGHPRDHNRVPFHVVVGAETAYGRQLLGERFRPPAVAVGRPTAEARVWTASPALRPASLVQSCAKVPYNLCNPLFGISSRCATAIDRARLWHDQFLGSQRAGGRSAPGFSLRPDAPDPSASSAERCASAGRRRPR